MDLGDCLEGALSIVKFDGARPIGIDLEFFDQATLAPAVTLANIDLRIAFIIHGHEIPHVSLGMLGKSKKGLVRIQTLHAHPPLDLGLNVRLVEKLASPGANGNPFISVRHTVRFARITVSNTEIEIYKPFLPAIEVIHVR